jgi:YfiH family protein
VPILLFDPINRAIGIAHAGWKGTVDKIAEKVVLSMIEQFGSDPDKLITAIGPSIGPDHYSIRKDVADRVRISFGEKADQLLRIDDGRTYFDLWKANQLILAENSVKQIEVCQLCTSCNMTDWYSHRGEHGKTGRFGVIFGLSE